MEDIRAGDDSVPAEVSPHPRLGRPVHQSQGAHQQRHRHEAVALLQGMSDA